MARKSAQVQAQEFENEMRAFLTEIGFEDLQGGPAFKLGGHQIDIVAGIEDAAVVVECAMSAKGQVKLRDEVTNLRGKIKDIETALANHETYKRYKQRRYVVAIRSKIPPSESSVEYAAGSGEVSVWDSGFIEYYKSLRQTLGKFAVYNLLGELGVLPRTKAVFEVPAFQLKVGKYNTYQFAVSPHKLLPFCYVARREIGKEQYYQRIVKGKRLGHIRSYIDGGGVFPTNLVLSLEEPVNFQPISEVKTKSPEWPDWVEFGLLSFPARYRTAWVIDGQHRLYAFAKSQASTPVSVWAFKGLELAEQSKFFVEINDEAEPVDTDLLWDLSGTTGQGERAVISNSVRLLNTKPPFEGRIYIPLEGPRKTGQIRMSGICSAIERSGLCRDHTVHPLGGPNPLFSIDSQERTKELVSDAMAQFFLDLQEICSEVEFEEFIFGSAGALEVMISLLERVVNFIRRAPKKEILHPFTLAIHEHLVSNYGTMDELARLRQICASIEGRDAVAKEFALSVRDRIGDSRFASDIRAEPVVEEISRIERGWARMLAQVLSAKDPNWLRSRVQKDIRDEANRRRGRDTTMPTEDFFTLGECMEISSQKQNWPLIEKFFIDSENPFSSKVEVEVAYRKLAELRTEPGHGRKARLTPQDRTITMSYITKFQACLNYYESLKQ
ncbi:MAG: DGQHR domain-containing protein [Nitrososphaerota archaeon]|nr:DGQHR domain-containing protein [Nitrososphaerota archaeon]